MNDIIIQGFTISPWFYAPVLYLAWVCFFLIVKKAFYVHIQRLAQKTESKLDDIILDALNFPLVLFIVSSGAFVFTRLSALYAHPVLKKYGALCFEMIAVLAFVLFLDKFLRNLIKTYKESVDLLKTSGGIIQGVARAFVFGIGLLVVLDSLGVSITPLLASLGVGSLAIALALQPTLENFFSGVQLVVDKPVKLGQFIRLETGEEGYVDKIGWRSTWIRLPPNNMIIIPNKLLVNSRVLNYHYPDKQMSVPITIGVHYASDLDHVERVTLDTARDVLKSVKGALPDFKPGLNYHTFDDFCIKFTVVLRCEEYMDQHALKHEFIKRLHKNYAKEGIVIPYPVRAVNYAQEKAD